MRPMTRRERRAERQRQYLMKGARPWASPDCRVSGENEGRRETDYEALLPGWLRPLDYKVSGETGALRVRGKARTWHLDGRANGHAPPPGHGWDRSGLTRLIEIGWTRLGKPIIHHNRRRLTAEAATASTDE